MFIACFFLSRCVNFRKLLRGHSDRATKNESQECRSSVLLRYGFGLASSSLVTFGDKGICSNAIVHSAPVASWYSKKTSIILTKIVGAVVVCYFDC